ncbi:MAG: hypothetical protein H0V35_06955 [Nitrospira sp.]|nr:hypothetical protein [Nitrospira sp.]
MGRDLTQAVGIVVKSAGSFPGDDRGQRCSTRTVIKDAELETPQKGQPVLMQLNHGHHDKKMKVQFARTSGEGLEKSGGNHQPARGDNRL